jgi:hypothetical protein
MSSMKLTAAAALLAAAASACAAPVDAATRQQVVQAAAREMDARYVFPEVARQVAAALAAKLKAREYDTLDDADRFAERLTADLQAITRDKHIRVRHSAQPLPPQQADPQPSAEERRQYRAQGEATNFGVERVERLPMNLGYIELRGFVDVALAAEAISAAMTLVAHADALIVDLRRNGGGDPATVAFMSSYLFDERTHLNSLYQREGNRTDQYWTQDWVPGKRFGQAKPVYVLTAKRTFSGAEEFSYNLKNLKRATLVGETTGGGAHPGSVRRLADHFSLFVPDGRAISPVTQTNWEGVGVEPDVKVPADDALRVAQLMALRQLAGRPADAERAKRLRDRIDELEKAKGGV